jgi:hypothetical protein
VIGEVWIPRNSNTPAVCRKLIADWETTSARAATGGSRGSAKVEGSDCYGDATAGSRSSARRARVNAAAGSRSKSG